MAAEKKCLLVQKDTIYTTIKYTIIILYLLVYVGYISMYKIFEKIFNAKFNYLKYLDCMFWNLFELLVKTCD